MKVRSKITGTVIDLSDEGARTLIAAGIYDAVESPAKPEPTPKKEPKKSDKPTKIEPLTTEDTPFVPTKTVT